MTRPAQELWGGFDFICDCGKRGSFEAERMAEAIEAALAEGWTVMQDDGGVVIYRCPECVKKEAGR